jgi:hypothetical protein
VARTPDTFGPSLRARLAQASAKLTEAHAPDLAAAVDEVLAPGGWETLRHTDPARSEEPIRNLATNIPKAVRDEIAKAVEADPEAASISAMANKGLVEYLAGRFQMPERSSTYGYGGQRVNLNWRPLHSLRAQIEERGVSVARVAVEYLMSYYRIGPYGLDQKPAPSLARDLTQMHLHVPPGLAAAIRERLALMEADLRGLVEEGFTKVLAGSWKPFKIPKAAKGSEYERDILPVRVSGALVEQVRDRCPQLKEELGYRVTPPTIAIDYLISELGLEDLADAEYGVTGD